MNEGSEEHAFGVEEPWRDGWDYTVVFDDEVVGGLEWETLDQLRDNLAASEGISEVVQEDREVFHLKVLNLDIPSVEAKVAEAIEQTDIGDSLITANPIAVCIVVGRYLINDASRLITNNPAMAHEFVSHMGQDHCDLL